MLRWARGGNRPTGLRCGLTHDSRTVLANIPYADAPVSDLFVFGRKQVLAFEKANDKSARHHVWFWRSDYLGRSSVHFWVGTETFDRSVSFSHLTHQITHYLGPDIDGERNGLVGDLWKGGWLTRAIPGQRRRCDTRRVQPGGNRYNGDLTVGVLVSCETRDRSSEQLDSPVAVR